MRRFALALLLAATVVRGQAPTSNSPAVVYTPAVNPDRTVTFTYTAPRATRVSVLIEGFQDPLPMAMGGAGVWKVTSPPLAPEYYGYHFEVDGGPQLDPRNPVVATGLTSAQNAFLVPGSPAAPWEMAAVPHGELHHHTFTTKIVTGLDQNQSEYFVYTPPGYDPGGKTRYPVLYLLHGWSSAAWAWSEQGRANEILDNLIAAGKARPMIVVMPLGYGDMDFVRHGIQIWNFAEPIQHNLDLFTQSLLTEVLPAVEREYKVSARREDRAIAGLSMGGFESLSIGLTHTGQFAWIGGFSSAVHMVKPGTFAAVDAKKADLRLLWVACGTEDGLIEPNRRLEAELKAQGLPVTAVETPGMHVWQVWRDNLVHFMPLLFSSK